MKETGVRGLPPKHHSPSTSISALRAELARKTKLLNREKWAREQLELELQDCWRHMIDITEREQRRIGQDLHDELCQYLTAAKFKHAVLRHCLESRFHREGRQAREVETMLTSAIDRAHRLARGLNPLQLESGGLLSALHELSANLRALYDCECDCECSWPVALDHSTTTHLYRIAQEAATNAIKHGRAGKIKIRLVAVESRVVLTVAGNGRGFRKHPEQGTGMGLPMMQKRAGLIGATLTFANARGGGTIVTCSLPRSAGP